MTTAHSKPPAKRATLVEAMDGIFLPWFPRASDGTDTWAGWKTVAKAMDALPMTAEDVAFLKEIAGGREPPGRRVSELTAVCARRTGKDSFASLVGAYGAATFDRQDVLRPGERAQVLCLACDRDQAKIVLNYIRSYYSDISALRAMVQRETASGFELSNQVDVSVATGSFRAVRGKPVLLAILDEAAFMRSETSASPDIELYAALRPGMLTIPGSRMIIISSPYRRSGLLWERYKKAFGKNDDNTLVIQASVRQLNPTISQAQINAETAEDPAAAVSELQGQFRDDISAMFATETIEAAIDYGVSVRPPRPDIEYVAFADPSGGARDSFTVAIAHMDDDDVAVLDCLLEIPAPFNPATATKRISDLLRGYNLGDVLGDRYGASWVVAEFDRNGIYYKHSERDRSAIYQDTLPLFTSGRARLLDNRRLVSQFIGLERRTSPIGKDRIDHGPGGMDDLCNSAAGALVNATRSSMYKLEVLPFWSFFGRRDSAEPDAETNFREAQEAFERGQLSGRDLVWFKLERQRRANLATTR